MAYSAQVVADSKAYGVRLTSILATFPRFILAEVNTHRMLSRNSASSRAIPVERRIASVVGATFVPEAFAANKRGMQAGAELDERDNSKARDVWYRAALKAADSAEALLGFGVHKQWANRLLEPFAWHTTILTATEWDNFFNLRTHTAAQPEFQKIAGMMREAFDASTPRELSAGDWHLPFISESECGRSAWEALIKVSVGRCAATSYERATDERKPEEWIALHDKLLPDGHLSPFEHQAQVVGPVEGPDPWEEPGRDGLVYSCPFSPVYVKSPPVGGYDGGWEVSHYACGNFRAPFLQYRKTLPGEAVWEPR